MTAPQLSKPLEGVGTSAPRVTTVAQTRRGRSNGLQEAIFYVLVALFIIFCLAPFIWTLDTSLKGDNTIFTVPVQYLPNPIDFANYNKIFHLSRFTHSLLNSLIVASAATVISLFIGSVCAYALARLQFPGKNVILALVLGIAMFPGIAIIGPLFRQFNAWHLTNNYWALILPNVTFTLPLCIWTLNAFIKIVAPLAAPGVFTAAILLFIQAWNEFLFARTFMTQENKLTATVAIAQFSGADVSSQFPWGQITAASIIVTLPLVILVLLFQRRIISGLTAGAVKG